MASTAILAIRIVSDATKAAKELDTVSQKTSKMGTVSKAAGVAFAAGLTVAVAGAVKLGQKASDLAETQSKVNQIFGEEGAAALDKFASSAAKNIGQSQQQALDAAATFGTFGKAAGLTGVELAGFSTELTSLASDMASFSNTTPQEAIEALGSGLRGEAEPLRKYGILLDDATLRQAALEKGIIKTTKQALTPQQKVLAAQAVILEQTKTAQGDFARTSDGLANKQRILRAQMENLGTSIGTVVLPAMVALTAAGLAAVQWVDEHRTTTAILVAVLGTLVAVVAAVNLITKAWIATQAAWAAITKVVAAGQWALNAALTANPIGLIIVAVIALIAGLVLLYKKSAAFRAIVQAVGKAGQAAIGWIVDKAKDLFNWIAARVPGAFNLAKTLIVGYIKLITAPFRTLLDVIKSVRDFIRDKAPAAFLAAKTLIVGYAEAMLAPFRALKDLIDKIINAIKNIDLPSLPDLNPLNRSSFGNGLSSSGPVVVQVQMNGSFVGSKTELAEELAPVFERVLNRQRRRVG